MFSLVAYAATILIIMFYVIVNYWAKSETKARFQPLRLVSCVCIQCTYYSGTSDNGHSQ